MLHIHISDVNLPFSKVIVDVFKSRHDEPFVLAQKINIPIKAQRFEEEIEFSAYQQITGLIINNMIYHKADVALGIDYGIIKYDDEFYMIYHIMMAYNNKIYSESSEKIQIPKKYYSIVNKCQSDRELNFFTLISPDFINICEFVKNEFGIDPIIYASDCIEKILKKNNLFE